MYVLCQILSTQCVRSPFGDKSRLGESKEQTTNQLVLIVYDDMLPQLLNSQQNWKICHCSNSRAIPN